MKYILRHYEPSANTETDEIDRQEAVQLFGEGAVRHAERTGIYEESYKTELYTDPGHFRLFVEDHEENR
jgi:hypothetical protein